MKTRLILVLSVLFCGAVLFSLYRAKIRTGDLAPSTQTNAPADTLPASALPADDPAATLPTSPPLAQAVAVPAHLQNPHALDPEPLKLRFAGPPFARQKDGRIHKTDVMKSAADLNNEDHETEEDLHILRSLVASYRTIFHQNPVAGENWEVVAALTGKNLYKLVFLDPAHPALNEQRELTDRWGTPFRFHPLSGSKMEFSSAGPDRHFGTSDDIHAEEPVPIGDRGTGS